MQTYSFAFKQMKESLFGSDFLIFVLCILTTIFMMGTILFSYVIRKNSVENRINPEKLYTKVTSSLLSIFDTLTVTFISLFPMLGMLGTVVGLLGLDLSTGDMENIKNNFFIALTSTAWGIVFSVFFKIIYALFADFVEAQREESKKIKELISQKKTESKKTDADIN